MRTTDSVTIAVGRAQGLHRAEAFSRQGFLEVAALELSLKIQEDFEKSRMEHRRGLQAWRMGSKGLVVRVPTALGDW